MDAFNRGNLVVSFDGIDNMFIVFIRQSWDNWIELLLYNYERSYIKTLLYVFRINKV